MVPPVSMTRSFINPKDRMAEVARRRQEAEKELRRRREERLKQLEERSENALKRKQIGLQEKLSKNKTESDHLREVNKRRLEKETQERQRIQQLLEKKNSPPRTTQTTAKPKSVVAFGSSVPRRIELTKGSSNRSASSSSMNATLNTTTSSLMTRSLHPALSPAKERPTLRANVKPLPARQPTANKPPIRPLNNRPPPKPTASPRKPTENRMTRSVHPELCPTPNKRILEMSQNSKPITSKRTTQVSKPPTKAEPKLKKKEDEVVPNIVIANESAVSKSTDSGINEPMEIHKIEESVNLAEPIAEIETLPVEEVKTSMEEPISESNAESIIDLGESIVEPKVEEPIVESKVDLGESIAEPKLEEPVVESIIDLAEPVAEIQPVVEANEQEIDEVSNDSILDLSESTAEPLQVEEIPIVDLAEQDIDEPKIEEPISKEEPTNAEPINTQPTELIADSVETTNETIEKPNNTEFGQIFDMGTSEEMPEAVPQLEYIHNRVSSDDRDSTRTRTLSPQPVFSDDEHDSGVVPETPSPPMTEQEPLNESKTNHLFLLNTNTDSNGAPPTLDNVLSQSSNQVPTDPEQNNSQKEHVNPPVLTNVGGGVVIGLTEKLQQERNNRQAKLNEILSRTREQSNSASPVKTSESDASALAKSLLARRNERLGEKSNDGSSSPPNKMSTDSEKKMVSLAEEFENLGLANNKFLLPGQLPDTHHHSNNLS